MIFNYRKPFIRIGELIETLRETQRASAEEIAGLFEGLMAGCLPEN